MSEQKQQVINNLLVNYYVWQPAQGKAVATIVLLHGWRCDARLWFTVAQQLAAAGYQVLAPDLPGFGKSQTPPENFDLQGYAALIEKLIDDLELSQPIVLGHSFGARVAIKLATWQPSSIFKLVLVASGGWRPKHRLGLQYLAKLVKPIFSLAFLRDLRRKIYQLLGAEDYVIRPELKKVFLNIVNEDLLAVAKDVRQPTLIVWGENDLTAPVGFAQELQRQIPGAQLAIISQAGHFAFLDKPQEFLRILVNFLQHAA